MTSTRDIMTPNPICVRTDESAAAAARNMVSEGVGALPLCGKDDKVKGMVTDRDLVTKIVGQGRDAGTFPAGDLNQQEAVTIGADDPVEQVLATMRTHQVRRLPVIDNQRLVGVVSLADVARTLPHTEVGELVDMLSR